MASADQLKALVDSFVEGDDERFFSVAMQVAAHEAKSGHGKLAEELRATIDDAKRRRGARQPVPIARPRGDLANLLAVSFPADRLVQMVLAKELDAQISRVLREHRHAAKILERGLALRRKLLLVGPPGTGKTLTASVLAGELGLPLLQVRLDGLITKMLGETAAKLRQIFDATGRTRGVYFFDEFDAIGSQRGLANDVGEIRRILNSFLQMIEQDASHSLVLAATNHAELLDPALLRRFDDVLQYRLPTPPQVVALLRTRLSSTAEKAINWRSLGRAAAGLSHAEIARAADEALKDAFINDRVPIQEEQVRLSLEERKRIASQLSR
jgi:SpoVK/Ycf46/Vps4 family AAA+-type ATPase